MKKFILAGNERTKHGFNVLVNRNGIKEKQKIHLTGGKIINPEEVDVKVIDNGTTKRIQIDAEELIKQLEEIHSVSPSFVKFLKDDKVKKVAKKNE